MKTWLVAGIGLALMGTPPFAAARSISEPIVAASPRSVTGAFSSTPQRESVPLADASACISHRAEARFRTGYDHLVHVENRCDRAARCAVSTNVSPTPIAITVAPRTTETVLTFRGSPAREFTAHVSCTLE